MPVEEYLLGNPSITHRNITYDGYKIYTFQGLYIFACKKNLKKKTINRIVSEQHVCTYSNKEKLNVFHNATSF